jgi:hypothetical protein
MVRLPDASTVPTPLSIVTPVAFEEFHESVVDCPFSIADGDALREMVGVGDGGGAGAGGGSTFAAAGTGAAFFAQPVPEMSKASRTIDATAIMYNALLIGGISFLVFLRSVLIAALPDTTTTSDNLKYITPLEGRK